VCSRKKVGGLGVRRIREFNFALLGKWCWRLLVDRECLWFRVLSARYGVEGGQVLDGGREVSTWWRDIAALHREGWFGENVSRSIGNGKSTLFWSDVWVGGVSFRNRFSRLFDLSVFKGEYVFQMCRLGWGVGGEAWSWRRQLFAWEEKLVGELTLLLRSVNLQVGREDRWRWDMETSHTFLVRSAYHFLTAHPNITSVVASPEIWQKDIPLKIVLFA